ncbi:MAG TPA: hypothetical protein VG942_00310 [Hyphomonadaceae bacterium]|nr:hypothetical protein [Hyphomonadaceae bacterium]
MRFVARFVVLLVGLSVQIDLTAQIAICFDPTGPDTLLKLLVCIRFRVAMLIGYLKEAKPAWLLWHFLPAIVVSLLITIAWTLKLSTKGRMSMAPLPLLRHPALRFAVLLFVVSVLYDLSGLLSSCFKLHPPIGSETMSMCFLYYVDGFIDIARYKGLLGLLWHYLPVIVAATVVMNSWGWDGKDCPERRK